MSLPGFRIAWGEPVHTGTRVRWFPDRPDWPDTGTVVGFAPAAGWLAKEGYDVAEFAASPVLDEAVLLVMVDARPPLFPEPFVAAFDPALLERADAGPRTSAN